MAAGEDLIGLSQDWFLPVSFGVSNTKSISNTCTNSTFKQRVSVIWNFGLLSQIKASSFDEKSNRVLIRLFKKRCETNVCLGLYRKKENKSSISKHSSVISKHHIPADV